jgi:hypothetical protein
MLAGKQTQPTQRQRQNTQWALQNVQLKLLQQQQTQPSNYLKTKGHFRTQLSIKNLLPPTV